MPQTQQANQFNQSQGDLELRSIKTDMFGALLPRSQLKEENACPDTQSPDSFLDLVLTGCWWSLCPPNGSVAIVSTLHVFRFGIPLPEIDHGAENKQIK